MHATVSAFCNCATTRIHEEPAARLKVVYLTCDMSCFTTPDLLKEKELFKNNFSFCCLPVIRFSDQILLPAHPCADAAVKRQASVTERARAVEAQVQRSLCESFKPGAGFIKD